MSQIIGRFITNDTVTGVDIRLDNNQNLRARNAANSADVNLLKLFTDDTLTLFSDFKLSTSYTSTIAGAGVALLSANVGDVKHAVFGTPDHPTDFDPFALYFMTGSNTFSGSVNRTGRIQIGTGNITSATATNQVGRLEIYTGNNAGTGAGAFSGLITLQTGNSASSTSGTITLQTGTAGTTRGQIVLNALNVDVSSTKIVNLATPTASTDAANKSYVDGLARVTSVTAGTGLNVGAGPGGTITSTGTLNLANTAVTAGSYTAANITVDAQGRITAATNGSAGGTWRKEVVTLTGGQITGGVTLSFTPLASSMQVVINGVVHQEGASYDYEISGAVVSFTAAFQTLLVAGDIVHFQYQS